MNETTPGPWNTDGTVIWGNSAASSAIAATRFPILTCHHCKAETPLQLKMPGGGTLSPVASDHEAYANAKLIAAAPELIAFCKRLRDDFYKKSLLVPVPIDELEGLIARAEGR